MKPIHEHVSAIQTEHLKSDSEPLRHRRPRLNEYLMNVLKETAADLMGATQNVMPSDTQTTESLHRLMVRLDQNISRDPESAEVDRRLSFQNVILSFFLVRLLAASIPGEHK